MKKSKKLSKKMDNLSGLSEEIINLLSINTTTKYVVKKTGKRKTTVGKVLKKLIEKGFIKRLDRGYYKVIQKVRVQTQVIQKNTKTTNKEQQKDYFRLHNLEIKLRVDSSVHRQFKTLIFKKRVFQNIR